jgi:hypothetical protein
VGISHLHANAPVTIQTVRGSKKLKQFSLLATFISQLGDSELEYPSSMRSMMETSRQMKKLRRRLALSVVAASVALVAASAPAGALAAAEGSGGHSTAAESVTESPSGATEPGVPATPEVTVPPVTPPASTGWIPQGSGSAPSSGGAAPTHRGSSLGSGGGPSPAESTSKESSSSSGSSSGSSGSYQPESSTPSTPSTFEAASTPSTPATLEEPTTSPQVGSESNPVEPPPAEPSAGKEFRTVVGAASPVVVPEAPQVVKTSFAPAAKAAAVASQVDQGSSGPGALWWLAVIVGGLILVYAAGRLLLEPTEPFSRRQPGRLRRRFM